MKKTIYMVFFLLSAGSLLAEEGWKSAGKGLEVRSISNSFEGEDYSVDFVKVDMNYYNFKIYGLYDYFLNLDGANDIGSARIEEREGTKVLIYNQFTLEDFMSVEKSPSFFTSVGYLSSNGEPKSLGLLKVQGEESVKYTDQYKYLSAILCELSSVQLKSTFPAMYTPEDYTKTSRCDSAIQVGSRIIEKRFKKGITNKKELQLEERLIFYIGRDEKVYLSYWDKISLYAAQEILLSNMIPPENQPIYAINISIREMSGMSVSNSKCKKSFGNNASKIPAVLAFIPKK